MLLNGSKRTYYELTAREKLDAAWSWVLNSSTGALSNPQEFRKEMRKIVYEGEDAATPDEPALDYIELPGKGGRVVRVPRPTKDTKLGPAPTPKFSDVTDADRDRFRSILSGDLRSLGDKM
jgi:hypothetical protein